MYIRVEMTFMTHNYKFSFLCYKIETDKVESLQSFLDSLTYTAVFLFKQSKSCLEFYFKF